MVENGEWKTANGKSALPFFISPFLLPPSILHFPSSYFRASLIQSIGMPQMNLRGVSPMLRY
ncbi:MAG: hypothetical protein MAG451_00089 [Anaerolineales bacterium]|nr:hypothetical protein [Anaerolineales bacterium]